MYKRQLLALLLHKPVEQLHGPEVAHVGRGGVAAVDALSDVPLVLLAGKQRREVIGEDLVGLGDGEHLDLHVVVKQVATQDLCVADLLLDLDHVPVGKALEAAVLVVVRKGEVEVCLLYTSARRFGVHWKANLRTEVFRSKKRSTGTQS